MSILEEIPKKYHSYLTDVEGEYKALNELKIDYFNSQNRHDNTEDQRVWECVALFFLNSNRPFQAITIMKELYYSLLKYQITGKQICP